MAADPFSQICIRTPKLNDVYLWRWKLGGGGLHLLVEQEGILYVCGEGHLLDGMVQEGGRRCPNVEVQHLRKREYPDEVERGAL